MSSTLLLVDDDPRLLSAMGDFFRARGFDVVPAGDLRSAEDALASRRFSLVITDLQLVEREAGLVVVTAARRRCPPTPVILLSGNVYPEVSVIAEKLGAARVLSKPRSLLELLFIAQELIENPN